MVNEEKMDMSPFIEISFQIEITIRMCKVSSAEVSKTDYVNRMVQLTTIEDAQKCYYSELDEQKFLLIPNFQSCTIMQDKEFLRQHQPSPS